MTKIKRQIYRIITPHSDNSRANKIFEFSIIVLVILSIACVIADTFDGLPMWLKTALPYIELVEGIIFTVEFLLRIWTADLIYSELPAWKARLKYVFSLSALIDFLAILPFYLPLIAHLNLKVLRVVRLVRLVRIFKLNRYSDAFTTIFKVLKLKSHQLVSSIFVVFLLMIIASIVMYGAEHDQQPDIFQNAFSGLWWAMATLTTVGYGDIYPVTELGRVLATVIALLGIGIVAVPTGIISAGFVEEIEQEEIQTSAEGSYAQQLEDLFDLKEKGIISEEEFEEKKRELLKRW